MLLVEQPLEKTIRCVNKWSLPNIDNYRYNLSPDYLGPF